MNPWFVVYETRPIGSIGAFSSSGVSIVADSKESALHQALSHFQSQNLDVRFPVNVYQYEENETL